MDSSVAMVYYTNVTPFADNGLVCIPMCIDVPRRATTGKGLSALPLSGHYEFCVGLCSS